MKKYLLVFLVLLMVHFVSYGQEDNYDINGFSIGITPSALLNIWTGYQGQVGYGFADHFEVSLNAGYLYGKRQSTSYDGYRIKPSVKYYFLNDYEANRFFVEVGYLRRVTNEEFLDTYSMFEGAFNKEIINNRDRIVDGGFAMYGSRQLIPGSNFFYEFSVGAGLGSVTVTNGIIENAEILPEENFFALNQEGKRPYLIVMFHLAVGYDF